MNEINENEYQKWRNTFTDPEDAARAAYALWHGSRFGIPDGAILFPSQPTEKMKIALHMYNSLTESQAQEVFDALVAAGIQEIFKR